MSKCTWNKVSYNVDDALDSDEEDLGQLEDDNDGDSSTDSKYNDDDNLVSIATNVSIPGVDQDVERVEIVVQEERPKHKRNIGPIMSLDTSLDETNYNAFDHSIPKEVWKAVLIRPHTNEQPQQFQVGDVMLLI